MEDQTPHSLSPSAQEEKPSLEDVFVDDTLNCIGEALNNFSQFFKKEIAHYKNKAERSEKLFLQMRDENLRLTEESSRLAKENSRMTEENSCLTNENSRLAKENSRLTEENSRLAEEKMKADNRIRELEEQLAKAASRRHKRGEKKVVITFRQLLQIDESEKDDYLRRLHARIDGQGGKDVAMVLLKAKEMKLIAKMPTEKEFCTEFHLNGSWKAIAHYLNPNCQQVCDISAVVI